MVLSTVNIFSSCCRTWYSIKILPWVRDCKASLFYLSLTTDVQRNCSCPWFMVGEGEHTYMVKRLVSSQPTHRGLKPGLLAASPPSPSSSIELPVNQPLMETRGHGPSVSSGRRHLPCGAWVQILILPLYCCLSLFRLLGCSGLHASLL